MTKKKYYDENGKQVRTRTEQPLYKKWSLWTIVFSFILLVTIGIYASSAKDKSEEDLVEKTESTTSESKKNESVHTSSTTKDEKQQTQIYSYEDFKGTYVQFTGEPYKSAIQGMSYILVIDNATYHTFDRWEFDMTSPIQTKSITGNTLTLNLNSAEDEIQGRHSESGTEQFELRYEGNKKTLYALTSGETFYAMNKKELQTHYNQSDIDYARIIMTMDGVPSLDSWAFFSYETGIEQMDIRVTHNVKGDFIPNTLDEGDVQYPEAVKTIYFQDLATQEEIRYTYASLEAGYIRNYPVPTHSSLTTGQEVIQDAKVQYIKPFEPYEVADFIGHVHFTNE